MNKAIEQLIEVIKADYRLGFTGRECKEETAARMIEEFENGIFVEEGRKYLKIVKTMGTQKVVWGFVVKNDTNKFRAGDILMAASWKSPATNKARGNIFDDTYQVRWTGPMYL